MWEAVELIHRQTEWLSVLQKLAWAAVRRTDWRGEPTGKDTSGERMVLATKRETGVGQLEGM